MEEKATKKKKFVVEVDELEVYLSEGHYRQGSDKQKNYSPTQARDDRGRWTKGTGVSSGPRKVSDIEEAVKAIIAGESIEIDSPKKVHTVLNRLAKMAQDAKEKGEDAPNYDLCGVSVAGTNVFCVKKIKTKEYPDGIPRIEMPQIGGVPVEGSIAESFPRNPWDTSEVDGSEPFVAHLKNKGITTRDTRKAVASLSASQRELVGPKVAKMMNDQSFDIAKNPIFITSDGYIVDGHHRWAANVGRDAEDGILGNREMPVREIDAPISDVLRIANEWTREVGLKGAAGVKKNSLIQNYSPTQPRDDRGRWSTTSGSGLGDSTQNKRLDASLSSLAEMQSMMRKGAPVKYKSSEELVLKQGTNFNPKEKPESVQQGVIKECYKNASKLAYKNPDKYTYVEGYALMSINLDMPIAHAWVVDKDGNVIDNTWEQPGRAYKGVPFKTDVMIQKMTESGVYGILSGAEPNLYLKEGVPKSDMRDWTKNENSVQVEDNFFDKIKNYNPDQPRDDKGRWASSSGVKTRTIESHKGKMIDLFEDNGAKDLSIETDTNHLEPSEMEAYIDSYSTGIPPKNQYEALNTWVGRDGCIMIQDYARGTNKREGVKEWVDGLDAATKSQKLKDDINVYRGMGTTKSQVDKMVKEGSFKTETFFATAINHERVEQFFTGYTAGYDAELKDFRKPTMFRIKAKEGTEGYFVDSRLPNWNFHNGLGEYIPSRDNTYKVTDVTYIGTGDNYQGAVVDLEIE